MSNNLYPVFFQPGASIDESLFNSHLDEHILEVLEVPGFLACRRYRLTLTKGSGYPAQYGYVNLYEVEGSATESRAALKAPNHRHAHPDWWSDVARSESFSEVIEGEFNPTNFERLFPVYSSPAAGVTSGEFDHWYARHAAANVRATSLLGQVSAYRVEVVTDSPEAFPEHLALYTLSGPPEQMLAETHAAQARGEVSSTGGLHLFASLEATAIGDRQVG